MEATHRENVREPSSLVRWLKKRGLPFKSSAAPKADEMFLAFCLAASPRAGKCSEAALLNPDLRRVIFEHVLTFKFKLQAEHGNTISPEVAGDALKTALKQAWDGTTLIVPPASYSLFSPLIIDKNISIEGFGAHNTIVYNCIPIRYCIQIRGERAETMVSISGIAIHERVAQEQQDMMDGSIFAGVSLDVRRGRAFLRHCELISDCKECARAVGIGASLDLKESGLRCSTEHACITLRDGGQLEAWDATISSAHGSGIEVTGQHSSARIKESTVRGCGQRGLVVSAGGEAVLDGCTVTGSRASGVLLTDPRSRAVLRDCTVAHNGMHGCSVQGEATLIAERNQVTANGRSGFAVTMEARARLVDNVVEQNRRSGLVVMDSARASLERNCFADNAKCGVLCHGAGVRVCLSGDVLTRNVGSGLVIQDKAKAWLEGLAIRGNSRFSVMVHGAGSAVYLAPRRRSSADLTRLEGGEVLVISESALPPPPPPPPPSGEEAPPAVVAGPVWVREVRSIGVGPAVAGSTRWIGAGGALGCVGLNQLSRVARWLWPADCLPCGSMSSPVGSSEGAAVLVPGSLQAVALAPLAVPPQRFSSSSWARTVDAPADPPARSPAA